jgi:NAD(P)-dependent dehydrogenase (short-subunit alcohol dehydrogenase family)
MTSDLYGKTAIITGASRGIGLAIARRFADDGARVLITALSPDELQAAVRELEALGHNVLSRAGDLTDPDEPALIVAEARDHWDRIDILINNAGIDHEAPLLEITLDGWEHTLAVMLTAPFRLSQLVGAEMVKAGAGSIVNMCSIDGRAVDGPYASYDVAKAGLLMLTRNLAVELGPAGVRCNSVSPGWVLTPMVEAGTAPPLLAEMKQNFSRVPIKRLIAVDEVAAACAFLASDDASAITGTDLTVDGGTEADLYVLASLAAQVSARREAAPDRLP